MSAAKRRFGGSAYESCHSPGHLGPRHVAHLVSVVAVMERWMMGDPFEVVARLEERERRQAESKEERAQKARQELEALFEGVSDDRRSDQRD